MIRIKVTPTEVEVELPENHHWKLSEAHRTSFFAHVAKLIKEARESAVVVNPQATDLDTTFGRVRLLTELCSAAEEGKIEATHRFKTGEPNDDDGEWYKLQQGRAVRITSRDGDLWSGVFVDDGLPFDGIHERRFESV